MEENTAMRDATNERPKRMPRMAVSFLYPI
jgi:hypothetical protein